MSDELILVQNNTTRSLAPTYPNKGQTQLLNLLPGVNRVPRNAWAAVESSDLVKHHLENELLVVLDEKAELAAMPLTRALAIVPTTLDKAVLREWRKNETRKPAIQAIDAQLEKLDGSKPDKDEEGVAGPAPISASSPMQPVGGGVDVSAPRTPRGRRR